jgi:major membrane immunogen (membrane-anchored lipoprotein)
MYDNEGATVSPKEMMAMATMLMEQAQAGEQL